MGSSVPPMQENTTTLPIQDAYLALQRILSETRCTILRTIPPFSIEVLQGSWTGLSPGSMTKHIYFHLESESKGTRIQAKTYWPFSLIASLLGGYTACFFILLIAVFVLSPYTILPFVRTPSGLFFIGLGVLIFILGILHIYSYLGRSVSAQRILLTLRIRGSPLHMKRTKVRLRPLRK